MLQTIASYCGYLASLFLIISLLVNNDLKFRWFNTFGTIAFIAYAIIVHAFPVLLTNGILFCINVYYLIKIYNRHEDFDWLEFKGDEKQLTKFFEFYKADIATYFPEVNQGQLMNNVNIAVTRDLVIANIFSASLDKDGTANVLINFTVKKYRDFKVGRFIFEKEKQLLISKGVKQIIYKTVFNKKHAHFLKVMGFVEDNDGRYFKQLC